MYMYINNHMHRAPFSDIERKKEVAKIDTCTCINVSLCMRMAWSLSSYFCKTPISFCSASSFPLSDFLSIILTAYSDEVAFSWTRNTSENAPLWGKGE